ncbi:uncharacterized protein F5891DRAFT_985702 [Suillus fuscotomentosus]|uniref:Uncharacterized protein n=1 Tax=Suillus fuscotomentosus TaxID=1912939 RepID=A0AAD4DTG3_9AGAM|nr:uncharacterized protein F5891DRAFT_985702 [Suillus fuscotomentosus]KAG1893645.1 hypothetical protein F5891DRAFT_985702 [Suillus fuscotomentosus]
MRNVQARTLPSPSGLLQLMLGLIMRKYLLACDVRFTQSRDCYIKQDIGRLPDGTTYCRVVQSSTEKIVSRVFFIKKQSANSNTGGQSPKKIPNSTIYLSPLSRIKDTVDITPQFQDCHGMGLILFTTEKSFTRKSCSD